MQEITINYADKKPEKAVFQTAFHGETWYRCPHCKNTFEYYSARRVKSDNGTTSIYACPHCNGKIFM